MANRVLLGKRGTEYGLWVSKPGVNVLSASGAQLMLSTGQRSLQIVRFGAFNRSSGSQPISWAALGYRPKIVVSSQLVTSLVYTGDNSATISVSGAAIDPYWNTPNKPTLSNRIEWFALGPGV
jgi:hypothetical protein